MSLFKKVALEGRRLVERDASTEKVLKTVALPEPQVLATQPIKVQRETWRSAIRRMTGGGQEMYVNLLNLARGIPIVQKLPDGRESEPIAVSPEVMLQANKALIEFVDGKAVAQTEVRAAEQETVDVERYRAMSDEELKKLVAGEAIEGEVK